MPSGKETSYTNLIINVAALGGLLVQLLTIMWAWDLLPVIIPAHYNFSGKPDGFGDKTDLFLLFGLSLVAYFGLGWLSRHPQKFNYPWKIDENNAEYQYRLASNFVQVLKAQTIWLFTCISLQSVNIAIGRAARLETSFIILILVVSSFTIIGYVFLASRSGKADR